MNEEKNKTNNEYDDEDIPKVDLPQDVTPIVSVEPLPEYTRPRKDGPGGE